MPKKFIDIPGKQGKTNQYQEWVVAFGIKKGVRRRKSNELFKLPPMLRDELTLDRFGTVVYSKLKKVSPSRLLDASHYYLRYHLFDSPFAVNVKIDDADEVLRSYHALSMVQTKELQTLAKYDRFNIVPREPGARLFDPNPERIVKTQLIGTAVMTNWLATQYMTSDRVTVEKFDQLMALKTQEMKKEVYTLIPKWERPDHVYLTAAKEKIIPPDVLYKTGKISLRDLGDILEPRRKEERLKLEMTYPLPEPSYECCICGLNKAYIKCMECENRCCQECIQSTYLDEGKSQKEMYILLHHTYCLRFGRHAQKVNKTKKGQNKSRAASRIR